MNDTTNPIMLGEAQFKKAVALASKTTPELTAAMDAINKAKDEFSGAPIKLMLALLHELPEEEVNALPRIDSTAAETDNPDLFMWKDPSSDAKPKEVSFYTVWPDSTPAGVKVIQELGWISCLSDPEKKRDHIPQEYKDKYSTPEARKGRKKYLIGKRGTVRAQHKQAVRLMHQFDAVNELAGCQATTMPGDEPDTYSTLIKVQSTVAGRESMDVEHFTVGAFLKLKVAAAAEHGGTLAALQATVARDTTKNKGVKPEAGIPALDGIKTPETSDRVATAWHSYLDHIITDKRGQDYAAFLKFLTGPGGASAVETLGDIRACLDDIFKIDGVSFIYAKTKEADLKHKAA